MTGSPLTQQERLTALLVDRATEGLDPRQLDELNELANAPPADAGIDDLLGDNGFDWAAAAVDLAWSPPADEPLPARLRDRVLTDAGKTLAELRRASLPAALAVDPVGATIPLRTPRPSSRAPWLLVAASLALAAVGWWRAWPESAPPPADLPRQYAEFVREPAGLAKAPWVGQEPAYENVTGEAVWRDADQHGFLRLVGLPPNDPAKAQYQLWIVDPRRDEKPVDGGVFDVNSPGEVIVPIDAKLTVDNPRVFAITLEKPGGVVVSAGPLLVVGSVAG
jgi:hypothetical protein